MSNMYIATLTTKTRPSLPREFFARIYETRDTIESDRKKIVGSIRTYSDDNEDNVDVVDVSCDSGDDAEVRSNSVYDPYKQQAVENSNLSFMPQLFLRSGVTPSQWNHLQVTHLHSTIDHANRVEQHLNGLTAFLARRKKKVGRPRRQRTTFSLEQTFKLESEYVRGEYISRSRRFELAASLSLTETQIKIWFQNRRAKDKRLEKARQDQRIRNVALAAGLSMCVQLPVGVCSLCQAPICLCACLQMQMPVLSSPPTNTITSVIDLETKISSANMKPL